MGPDDSTAEGTAGSSSDVIPLNRIDEGFVPLGLDSAAVVSIGEELVLVDGWRSATVLNPTGAAIWESFDGTADLASVIDDLAALAGADRRLVEESVLVFTREVGGLGLLRNAGPSDDVDDSIQLVEVERFDKIGMELPNIDLVDLDGIGSSSAELAGGELILINWSPDCGYCASITHDLARCTATLAERGVRLVLLASGTPDANRALLDAASLDASVFQLAETQTAPFPGVGTPAAYHLDRGLRLMSEPAYGNLEVPKLVADVAGVDLDNIPPAGDRGVRYLLDAGGACPQGVRGGDTTRWLGTRVYRVAGYHVGIRFDSEDTASVLDALFAGGEIDDARAGHSFSIVLPRADADSSGEVRQKESERLGLLMRGADVLVRSRSVTRVLRALLWRLDDEIIDSDVADDYLQVRATPALVGSGIVLLQPGLHVISERLQPLLATRGIALADVPRPRIDLRRREVVLPDPAVPHDPVVLERFDRPLRSHAELGAVAPGRYPLLGWAVMHPADDQVTRFSPAQAAAATLSFVEHPGDATARLAQLGSLFDRVQGFGVWYHAELGYADALTEALGFM